MVFQTCSKQLLPPGFSGLTMNVWQETFKMPVNKHRMTNMVKPQRREGSVFYTWKKTLLWLTCEWEDSFLSSTAIEGLLLLLPLLLHVNLFPQQHHVRGRVIRISQHAFTLKGHPLTPSLQAHLLPVMQGSPTQTLAIASCHVSSGSVLYLQMDKMNPISYPITEQINHIADNLSLPVSLPLKTKHL